MCKVWTYLSRLYQSSIRSKNNLAFKTAPQNLCEKSQKAEMQSINQKHNQLLMNNKICQRSAHGEQKPKIAFTHMLSNILGYLYSKSNEEQNSVEEEDLKNNIILDSGSSIDILEIFR